MTARRMKKGESDPWDDAVVEEVRAIRAEMWAEAGGTVEGLKALIERKSSKPKPTKQPKAKRPARKASTKTKRRAG